MNAESQTSYGELGVGRIRIWDGKTLLQKEDNSIAALIATKHEARQDARPLSSVTLTGTERNSHRAQMRRIDIVLRKEQFGSGTSECFQKSRKKGKKVLYQQKWNKSKKAVYSSSLALRKARSRGAAWRNSL